MNTDPAGFGINQVNHSILHKLFMFYSQFCNKPMRICGKICVDLEIQFVFPFFCRQAPQPVCTVPGTWSQGDQQKPEHNTTLGRPTTAVSSGQWLARSGRPLTPICLSQRQVDSIYSLIFSFAQHPFCISRRGVVCFL